VLQFDHITVGSDFSLRELNIHQHFGPERRDPASRNRRAMIEKVWATWITGFLQPSLPQDILLELGLTERPALVTRTLDLYAQRPDLTDQPLAPGTRLLDVFDRLGRALLILGAPGSGKTTLLLTLAQDLLVRAAQDSEQPIPVVFPLSSWVQQRRPLVDWLVDALHEQYDVPRKLGQAWVNADQVLPLLDGLDEVAPEHRAACAEAINTFRQDHGLLPLVVCSRVDDYETLGTRLRLQGAVVAQPLTPQQVESYLTQVGTPLAAVCHALQQDPTLWELLDTPLMLHMVTVACAGGAGEALRAQGTLAERWVYLFETYVDRMFQRRRAITADAREQAERWLTWLAWQMTEHGLTVFHLERMQFTWLPARLRLRLKNYRKRTALRIGLLVGLVAMLVVGLLVGVAAGPLVGVIITLNVGPLIGGLFLLVAATGVFVGTIRSASEVNEELRRRAAAVGIEAGPDRSLKEISVELWRRAAAGEQHLSAMIPAVIWWPITSEDIISVETLRWSWSALEPWQWCGLLVFVLMSGLGIGLITGLLWGVAVGVFCGVAETLFWGLVLIFGASLARSEIETKTVPNEGIRRSARHALRTGLAGGLVGGLAGGLLAGVGSALGFTPILGLLAVLGFGLCFGLAAWTRYGGYTCLQHRRLRRLLIRSGFTPRDYVDFLDYAAERIFLRKLGGGYMFIHRLLQDYFAARYTGAGIVTEPRWWERIGFRARLLTILAAPLAPLRYGLLRSKSPVEQAFTRMGNRLAATPEFQAATAGLSKTEIGAFGQDMIRKGLSRLDDASLLARASIMEKMLTVADSAMCSAITCGTATPAQLFEVIAKLDAATMNTWVALLEKAALSELRKHPLRQMIEGSVASTSFKVLLDTLPSDEAERLRSIWNDDSQVSDEDCCWAERTFYKTLNSLGEPHRSTLARAVVQ
jgi:eukaryotic-like serine/threonine-protein kinase